jgi:hypothetical protein
MGALRPDVLTIAPARRADDVPHREFVEVSAAAPALAVAVAEPPTDEESPPVPAAATDPGWSLWGDPDRAI